MTLHRLVLAFALSGASLYGCGSDPTPNDPVTIPPPDAGVTGKLDAATTPPSSDAARPDAAVAADSAAPARDGGTVDSGARDSGRVADSGKAQDSGPGVVDSGAPPTVDSGMPTPATGDPRSAACLKCEMTECNAMRWPNSDFTFTTCSDFGTETVLGGVAMGMPRRAVCEKALTCVRETRCADPLIKVDDKGIAMNPDAINCLCGISNEECSTAKDLSALKGACRNELADAAETDDLQTILEDLTNPEKPLGVVFRRTQCSQNLCADECYAPCKSAAEGASCAGALVLELDGGAPAPGAGGTCSKQQCVDYMAGHRYE